jgi:GntR family transcriptional regulator
MSERATIGLDEIAAVHASPTTLYHSVGHVIRSKIQSGDWAVGQRIPSERELTDILNVSRATVRQGIENLVKEGVLYRAQGKGTFVAPPKIEQGVLRLLEFSEVIRQSGLKPSVHLLGKEYVDPPPHVRRLLDLPDSAPAAWLQRLLLVNQAPMLIEASFFSAARFPHLLEIYDGMEEPHKFVYQHYGIQVVRARETLEPVILEDREAGLLGVEGGFPALWVEHTAFDAAEKPVAYLTSLMRGDRCRFYTDLVFD